MDSKLLEKEYNELLFGLDAETAESLESLLKTLEQISKLFLDMLKLMLTNGEIQFVNYKRR